jgi:hypothetical protein
VNRLSGPASLPGMQPSQTLAAANFGSSGQTSPATAENTTASAAASSPRHFATVFSKALQSEEQPSSGLARKPTQNQSSSPNVLPSAEQSAAVARPLSLMDMLALAEGTPSASNPEAETGDVPINSSSPLLDEDGQLAPAATTPAAPQSGKSKTGTTNGNSQDCPADSGALSAGGLSLGATSQTNGLGLLASLSLAGATPREPFPNLEREWGSEVFAGKSSAGSDSTGVASGGNALTLGSGGTNPSSSSFLANRGELAFSARLVSLNPAEQAQSGATAEQKMQIPNGGQNSNDVDPSGPESAGESATPAWPASSQENDHGSTARALQPDALADPIQPSGGAGSSQNLATPFAQAIEVQSSGAGQHASGSPATSAEIRPGTAPEPAHLDATKAEPAARDIKLQVSEGDQRAEVRLVERGGVVQMSVRTPDVKLAGTLREDLPSLSAKLENAGFRAEVWRPAATAGSAIRQLSESLNGQNLQQDDSGRRRQDPREQNETPQPRQPKVKPADSGDTQAEKEFAWYISNLR